ATLVALAIEGMATVTDEIIDLHDRIIGKLFNAAKNKHQQQFQASGKAINDKVRMYGRIERTLFILDWLQSVELRRRVHAGLNKGEALDDTLLQYLSPLGWEHINLTGDYLWRSSAKVGAGKFRPLRPLPPA
ncbi:TPA: Tn3 family transposase, partial [Escherichia coli]